MKTSAEICRENGWLPGTVLEGNEGYGPDQILITAIGERCVLARQVKRNGKPIKSGRESLWTLKWRDWKKVGKIQPLGGKS